MTGIWATVLPSPAAPGWNWALDQHVSPSTCYPRGPSGLDPTYGGQAHHPTYQGSERAQHSGKGAPGGGRDKEHTSARAQTCTCAHTNRPHGYVCTHIHRHKHTSKIRVHSGTEASTEALTCVHLHDVCAYSLTHRHTPHTGTDVLLLPVPSPVHF